MKLLVCGGRDYQDAAAVDVVLSAVHAQNPISVLIHGKCHLGGADLLGELWAKARGIPDAAYPVDTSIDGPWPAAGNVRNGRMLETGRPDAVVAFPGGRGTADMVRRAHAVGVPVWEPYRPQPTVERTTTVWSFDAESQASKTQADLRKFGSRFYLSHPSCKCVLFAYHPIGAPERPKVWFHGQPPPPDLLAHVAAGGKLSGWNVSQFDRLLWDWRLVQDHGFPPIPPEAWLDSMHTAAAANLPRGLAGACKAVGVPFVEDLKDQNRLLRITDTDRTPVIGQDDLEWLTNRCVQDVLMEEQALMAMPPWPVVSPWVRMPAVDQRINDRGVLMDVSLVQGLARAATLETKRLDGELCKLTNGHVEATTQVERLKTWLVLNGVDLPRIAEKPKPKSDDPQEMLDEIQDADMAGDKEAELDLDNLDFRLRKSDIADLLARTDVPEHCRQALRMRAEAAKASAKKLNAMLKSASPDGRLRGALVLGGAQQTLRWCLAEGTPVLVRSGSCIISEKSIEFVLRTDQVWDGDSWVEHDGVVFSGMKHIVTYDGLTATPEHEVFVSDTRKIQLGAAIAQRIPLFRGNSRPDISSVLFSSPESQTVFRFDFYIDDSTMVGPHYDGASARSQTADTGRNLVLRTGSISGNRGRDWTHQATSDRNRTVSDRDVSNDGSFVWLQHYRWWRTSAVRSGSAFLARNQERSGKTRRLPSSIERRGEERRPDETDTRSNGGAKTLARTKPGQDDGTGTQGTCRLRQVACCAPSENISAARSRESSVGIGETPRPAIDGRRSAVAPSNRYRAQDSWGCHIGGCKGTICDIVQRRKTKSRCPVESCASDGGRNQKNQTGQRGPGCILDTGATGDQSRENASNVRRASSAGRVRTFDILNAGPRNRFLAAGRIVSNSGAVWQPHNFVRDVIANPDEVADTNGWNVKTDKARVARAAAQSLTVAIDAGRTGDPRLIETLFGMWRKDLQGRPYYDGTLPFISRMMRRTLAAMIRKIFLNGDFASIEARIPVWLAQQTNMVEAFARGEDVYRLAASPVYGQPPAQLTKEQRQIGKVMVLFLGFAGGVNAFIPAAMNYGLSIDRETGAGIVRTFRQVNSDLTTFWDALLLAAIYAVANPGYRYDVPPLNIISWFVQGGALCCQLPSGRLLRYWSPRLQAGKWPDGRPKAIPDLTALSVKGRAVFRRTLWRGLLCENVTQAIAADLLAVALDNFDRYTDDAGLSRIPIVLHVHDNCVGEVNEDQAEALLPIFKAAMLDAPAWTKGLGTKGLPLDAAVGIEARFS